VRASSPAVLSCDAALCNFRAERVARSEDCVLHENVPAFDVKQSIVKALSPTHDIFSIIINPVAVGWPAMGSRRFTIAIKRTSLKLDDK
jgi:hypothetical protein